MSSQFFNVQTVNPETGGERWLTVRAPDADTARDAVAARGMVVGEIRTADPRVARSAVAEEEYNPVPLEEEKQPHATGKCGVCGAPMGADSRVCGLCAYDDRKGIQSSTLVRTVTEEGRRIVQCKACGYDLSGLPTAKCPECGTNNIDKHNLLEGVSEETARAAYTKPAVALVAGLTGAFLTAGLAGGTAGIVILIQMLVLLFPLALVVGAICLITWIGVDYAWDLTLLQLSAATSIFAMMGAIGYVPIHNPVMAGVIGFFSLWAALTYLLDLDLQDAILMSVAIFILYVFGSLIIYI